MPIFYVITRPGVSYTYDEAGQMLAASRGGATVSFTYDIAGRKLTRSDPDMENWSYDEYDALGNLKLQKDARGQRTCLYYDSLDRLVGKSYYTDVNGSCTGPTVTFTYCALQPQQQAVINYSAISIRCGPTNLYSKTITGSGTFVTSGGGGSRG